MNSESIEDSHASNENVEAVGSILRPNSEDVGWKYGHIANPTNRDKIKCDFCGKITSGGISRFKSHIAGLKGQVKNCPRATDEARLDCKTSIENYQSKNKAKKKQESEVREEVSIAEDEDEDDVSIWESGKKKAPNMVGPIDKFSKSMNLDSKMNARQQNINEAISKERKQKVDEYMARWVYESGIAFNAVDNDSFRRFVEAVGQFGPRYIPPSPYQLREPLLKKKVELTKASLKKHEEEWAFTGCSIMTDAWTDRKRRSIMNLCVNCRFGTTFISSKETSSEAHTGAYIFDYVDKCIEDIGEDKVVQVVTDNASNNMNAAKKLLEKRASLFWTSCATHTLNLMLEGIGKLSKFKSVIEKAKTLTIFLYAHHSSLALMRKFTKKRDIVRPGVTRFATSFLTLQSLMEKKDSLRKMFTDSKWEKCKHSKTIKGKVAYAIVLDLSWWNGVTKCLKVFAPLVRVLRLVDGDRKPSMAFLYGELEKAKREIKEVFNNNESAYKPILNIVEEKAKGRLDSSLHLAAYFLNPHYFYQDSSIQLQASITDGLFDCIERFYPKDLTTHQTILNKELPMYKKKEASFGRSYALQSCINNDDFDPVEWWSNFGNHASNLQKMAMRILALTTSSSGC